MMQSCSCYHVVGGSCSCGWFHNHMNNNINSFSSSSILFTEMPNTTDMYSSGGGGGGYGGYGYGYGYSPPCSSSSSVDCTLSLGTPSTRLMTSNGQNINHHDKRRSSCVSKFCSWDFLKSESKESSTSAHNNKNNHRVSNHNSGSHYSGTTGTGGDSLSARRCANCDTTSTPLWRNGPKGPKSLCNACGIRYKKEERRATAKAATMTNDHNSSGGGAVVDGGHYYMQNSNSYVQNQNLSYSSNYYSSSSGGNEFRFMEDDNDRDSNGISFLSWRLNVTDRPAALVHDFTR